MEQSAFTTSLERKGSTSFTCATTRNMFKVLYNLVRKADFQILTLSFFPIITRFAVQVLR